MPTYLQKGRPKSAKADVLLVPPERPFALLHPVRVDLFPSAADCMERGIWQGLSKWERDRDGNDEFEVQQNPNF